MNFLSGIMVAELNPYNDSEGGQLWEKRIKLDYFHKCVSPYLFQTNVLMNPNTNIYVKTYLFPLCMHKVTVNS